MPSESLLTRLEAEFNAPADHIKATVSLLESGAPAAFIYRYRHRETGGIPEDRLVEFQERWAFLKEHESRKQSILEQAQDRATDEFKATLEETIDQNALDDIYQSFRPRRATQGMKFEELGLGPLALAIQHRSLGDKSLQETAAEYVSEEKGLPNLETALGGALYILAEQFAREPGFRTRIRDELSRGILKATAVAPGRKGAQRYKEFFEFEEPVRRIHADRMLALRRAERDGIIKIALALPEGREVEIGRELFAADLTEESPLRAFLDLTFIHAYDQHLRPACEADIRRKIKEKADRETLRSFGHILRAQLLGPALGTKTAMAARVSNKTIWLACLGEDGSLLGRESIRLTKKPKRKKAKAPKQGTETAQQAPAEAADSSEQPAAETPSSATGDETAQQAPAEAADSPEQPAAETPSSATGDETAQQAPTEATDSPEQPAAETPDSGSLPRDSVIDKIARFIDKWQPAAVTTPHGKRQGAGESLIREALGRSSAGAAAVHVSTDETPSTIYAGSPTGRKALGMNEVGMRTTVSLAQRLQDPLQALVRMDPRSLGAGQRLDEVHQGMLARTLDHTLNWCLATVGVDLNRADATLMEHAPGLSKDLAKAVVAHRSKIGGFKNREQLKEVDGIDENIFIHIAGFLRIEGGDEPLDATAIHPENYELAQRIAASQDKPVAELFGKNLRNINPDPFVTDDIDRESVIGLLKDLSLVGRDPRGQLAACKNDQISSIEDLKVDMQLRGRIASMTDFGMFVDLGIEHDGLLHVSQIPPSRMHDRNQPLCIGEVVTVFLVNVDPKAKRISLTMHKPRHLVDGRQPTVGERLPGKRGRRRREEVQPQTRAARAPDSRRGTGRGRPRSPGTDGGPGHDRGERRGPKRGGRPGSGAGTPRVITVESGKLIEESRGHKGELRSLSGLRNLLTDPSDTDKNESADDKS